MNTMANDIPTWMSIVFTVMCGLITLLIGWQIAQGLNFNSKMREMRSIIDKRISDYDGHFTAAVCLAMGKISVHSHEIVSSMGRHSEALNQALEHIVQAFENINNCPIKDNITSAYEALDDTIKIIENELLNLIDIKTDTIQNVIRVVMQDTSHDDKVDKIAILNRLLELKRKLELVNQD